MKTKLFILAIVILALLTSCAAEAVSGIVMEKERIVRASGEHVNIITLMSNDERKLIEVTSAVFDVVALGQRYEFECISAARCIVYNEAKLQEGGKVDQ